MKRCPTCGSLRDDGEKFCDQDGTPLVEVVAVVGPGRRVPVWAVGAAALLAGAAVFAAALLLLPFSSEEREDSSQSNQQASAGRGAPLPLESTGRPAPTPTPAEVTPTPEESPTPSPTPTPPPATPESPLSTLSDAPASTGGREAEQFVIRLDDGTSITADDAWRAQDGVWYRRGGMVSRLDAARIRSVERPPRQPPTPEP